MTELNYDQKESNYFTLGREEMVQYIPKTSQTLLEIGCGGGEFMKTLRKTMSLHSTAIEPFAGAAKLARQHFDVVIEADVDAGLRELKYSRFDCIVMNDVLEHLLEPWEILKVLLPLLSPQGVLVASIPNIRYFPVLRDLVLNGAWSYQDYGVLDRTHLRFFTQSSIREMFDTSGFKVDRIEGINPMKLSWKLRILFFTGGAKIADAQFQQFACVARATR